MIRAATLRQLGQLYGAGHSFHKGTGAHCHIQQNAVASGGQLFAHNAGGDQRNALHRRRHIPQRVHLPVRRGHLAALPHHGNPQPVDLVKKFLFAQGNPGTRHRFHLVHGAAGVAKPTAAHFGHLYAAGRRHRGHNQRGFIPHAAGGMLVHLHALNGRKIGHLAGVRHQIGELGRLIPGHPF